MSFLRNFYIDQLPLRVFYRTKDYHQKYILNRRPELAKELARIFPRKKDFVNSTAVAHLNAYTGEFGNMEQLVYDIENLGEP